MNLREQYQSMPVEVLEETLLAGTLSADDKEICKQVLDEKKGSTHPVQQNNGLRSLDSVNYRSNYGTARFVAMFMSFVGWLVSHQFGVL